MIKKQGEESKRKSIALKTSYDESSENESDEDDEEMNKIERSFMKFMKFNKKLKKKRRLDNYQGEQEKRRWSHALNATYRATFNNIVQCSRRVLKEAKMKH